MKQFLHNQPRAKKCAGCGKVTRKLFVWTHEKTKKKSGYCGDCDDLLIQDQPLPLPRKK